MPPRKHRRSSFLATAAVAVALLVLPVALSCRSPEEPPASGIEKAEPGPPLVKAPRAPEGAPNILLFSIDTLRADHLGCYGYDRPTSPRIDEFAAAAIRFSRAWAPAPWTLPAHAEMLTGRHPYQIGVVTKRSSLPGGILLLAELLTAGGYDTAAFVDSSSTGLLGGDRGFARGFDTYRHAPHREDSAYEYDMQVTLEVAREWLRERRGAERPFFLFLHTKSVHTVREGTPRPDDRTPPYDVPAEAERFLFVGPEAARLAWNDPERGASVLLLKSLNASFWSGEMNPADFPRDHLEALVGLYDGGIRYVDRRFGLLLDALEAEGLSDSTVVVLVSDHGEAFLEHGRLLHMEVYRQLLHVPLVVRLPGGEGGRVVDDDVRLADLVPTLLEQARLPLPPDLDGRPLRLGEDEPEKGERTLFAAYYERPPDVETQLPVWADERVARHLKTDPTWIARRYAVRRGDWTLVHNDFLDVMEPTSELYDTRDDPGELRPVGGRAEITEALLKSLAEWRARGGLRPEGELELDEETLERLRGLGYVVD